MAENSEKRFQKVMDKLYLAPSPKPRPPLPRGKRALELGRQERLRLPRDSIGSLGLVPQCRPWDRGDLMRRLATYKAMTWFGKPKVVNPVNCARRGWINVEMDTIACEACGARLLFSTPSSWSLQQVEKAAAVFSLKLDNGHKLLCPWIDNVCDEALALLPPTPPAALIEGYKERASMLIRLSALPAISSSTREYMKSPQLTQLLLQSSLQPVSLASGIKLSDLSGDKDLDGVSESAFSDLYYQSLKIISICGWEPRLLPYSVDHEEQSSPANGAHSSGSSVQISTDEKIIIYPAGHSDDGKVGRHIPHTLDEYQYDPPSVVLDCRLCGACVGLWAFATAPRPLELFSIIASPDSNGQDESLTSKDLHSGAGAVRTEKTKIKDGISGTNYSGVIAGEKPSRLNLTIAGGPPPTKQNFKPRVSFPIISRHLRAQLSPDFGFRNYHSSGSSCMNATEKQSVLVSHVDDLPQNKKDTNDDPVISEHSLHSGSLKRKRADDVLIPENSQEHFVNSEDQLQIMPSASNDPGATDNNPGCVEEEAPHAFATVGDDAKAEGLCSISNATAISAHVDVIEKDGDSSTTKKLVLQKATKSDHHEVSEARGAQSNYGEFDPIRQHRPFCPWIAPVDGKSTPGWRLTLSALVQQEKSSSLPSSQPESLPALLDEADDPVVSIQKLFMSPATRKKIKSSH